MSTYDSSYDDDRYARAMQQRIYLLSMKQTDNIIPKTTQHVYVFNVMGTTGNVYDVTIDFTPTCTCPDFIRRHKRCKHIHFVLSKVMGNYNQTERRMSVDALCKLYDNIANIVREVFAPDTYLSKFECIVSTTATSATASSADTYKKQIGMDDVCPVCLCDMNKDKETLDYCKMGCGRTIHADCFKQWSTRNKSQCVFCRTSWEIPKQTKTTDDQEQQQYVNLCN